MNTLFCVYLHNCCALCLKHSLILLLLGLNKKSSMHVILILQRDRATLSCSLALCFGVRNKISKTFESRERLTFITGISTQSFILPPKWLHVGHLSENASSSAWSPVPMDKFSAWNSLQDLNLCFSLRVSRNPLSPILQCHSLTAKAFQFYMDVFGKMWEKLLEA